MGNKTCNKCSKEGLGWDMSNHASTGKWKLESHRDPKGEWCAKPASPTTKMVTTTKKDWYRCPKCEGQYGWLLTASAHETYPNITYYTLEEHDKINHA